MQLSDEAIQEYIKIYETDFAETVSVAEAREVAWRFVMLYVLLLRPPLAAPSNQFP